MRLCHIAYTNFVKLLTRESDLVDVMFYSQVKKLIKLLLGFSKTVAIDSKAISSRSRKESKRSHIDFRGEADVDRGVKTYKGKRKDGSMWKSVKGWF